MNSLSKKYLEQITFSSKETALVKKLGEFKGRQDLFEMQTPEILDSLKQTAIVESTESSNRIEGITAHHKRIQNIVLKNNAPKNRSEQEIAGYRDALNLIHESAKYMELSKNNILQLHQYVYRYMPEEGGEFKMADNEIVDRYPDGTVKRVRFKPVSAPLTPIATETLAEKYKLAIKEFEIEPLVVIPLTILDFLCIHPFRDGNGRVSRLLSILLLYHFDYKIARYISLERIFEESKESYYETLEKCSVGWHEEKHNCLPWIIYFWGVLIRAYKEFEERVGVLRTGRGSKTELVKGAISRRIGPFSISDLENDCPNVSRDMIRNVIRQLRDRGSLKAVGKGRAAKWEKR